MLYILFGEDDFSLHQALDEIKNGLDDREMLASNTTVLDGSQLSLNQLMNTCDALPFLAQKRLVIVEGLLARFDQKGRRRKARIPQLDEEWRGLGSYLPGMSPSTVLILIDGGVGKGNPLFRELSPEATVKEFPSPRGTRLNGWIWERVKKGGGSISPSAVQLLADLIGGNLWVMDSEIEKLLLYARGRRVEERDVRSVVSYARESNIFAMIDAIMERKTSVATTLLHRLLNEGAAAPYLLFMITRQFRMLVQTKELASQRLPSIEVQKRSGLTSEYAFRKTMEQAKGFSMKQLEEVYRRLLDTDVSIKTGRQRGELALDLLITELCQGRGTEGARTF